jgi:hypothetical protein
MKKFLTYFSYLVIFLFILSLFGWMVNHMTRGDKQFGLLEKPVKFMYTFPDLFSQSVEEVKTLPQTFIRTADGFQSINKLEKDLIVLYSYSDTSDTRSIVLQNLKNDSIYYRWRVNNPFEEHDRIKNPLLFPDKNLVYSYAGKPLQRIDSLSNVIWKQDSIWSHHSLELDSKGDIWTCTFAPVYYTTGHYKLDGRSVFFKDNYLTKVDAESGRILFHKSMTEILAENGLSHHILKSSQILDPIHMNDIQPALKTTAFYQEGDLFISNRQPSFVMHYRPSTNEVIRMIEGPFVSQHDVDFLDDENLVIFNNNYYTVGTNASDPPPKDSSTLAFAGDFYSNLIRYNLKDESFSFIGDSLFRANRIFTYTEGLQEFIAPSTYFVEEQNSGLLWVIKEDEVLYKNVLSSPHEGYHHLPNWIRIIE